MTIECRYCREKIVLNPDSLEARRMRLDPHQQMRRHIVAKHLLSVASHARALGWLVDMLHFQCPEDPAEWKARIVKLLDYYLAENSPPTGQNR